MFDLSSSSLFASLIWGSIGGGMTLYGWKQKSSVPLGCGLALTALTYFISSAWLMSAMGAAILGVMYWLKKQGY